MKINSYFMKIWLPIKIWLATKKYGKKQTTYKEFRAIKKFMDKYKLWDKKPEDFKILKYLAYKKDRLFDFQKPAYKTINDWGGDCEDLHRVAQLVIAKMLGIKEVYLIQAIGTKSHALVGYKFQGNKYIYDYDKVIRVQTFRNGVKAFMSMRYNSVIDFSYITDIGWNKIKGQI